MVERRIMVVKAELKENQTDVRGTTEALGLDDE